MMRLALKECVMSVCSNLIKKYQEMTVFEDIELNRFDQHGSLDQDTPIHWACYKGILEDVKSMVKTDIDVNVIGDIGNTPLHQAASKNHYEIVKFLLNSGADPKVKNIYGDLAEDCVSEPDEKDIIKLLRKYERKE